MQTPNRFASIVIAMGLMVVAASAVNAAPERSLLGIRIWSSANTVLAKYRQPTRIESAKDTMGGAVTAISPSAPGGLGGSVGLPGLGGLGIPSGPGSQLEEGGSTATAMLQAFNSAVGAGVGTGAGLYGGGGSSYPGAMGPSGGMGAMSMGGSPMGGGMASSTGISDMDQGETQWIYEGKNGNLNIFLLNSDYRIIQIQSFGYKGGGVTAKGIRLGDNLSKVFKAYGTTSNVTNEGKVMTLRYTKDQHCAFQLYDNGKGYKVVSITIAAVEKAP